MKNDFKDIAKDLKFPNSVYPKVDVASRINKFSGVLAVSDVHGDKNAIDSALRYAATNDLFVLFLGDIIDYGPDSVYTLEKAYEWMMADKADAIMGNHEKKVARYYQQEYTTGLITVRLSEGNRATTDAVANLSENDRNDWMDKFFYVVSKMTGTWEYDSLVASHGAIHHSYWTDERKDKRIAEYGFYGQVDRVKPIQESGHPRRTYEWTNSVPADKHVVVGHDIRSKIEPLVVINENGGTTIFLDTGASKGGTVSGAHFNLVKGKLMFEKTMPFV